MTQPLAIPPARQAVLSVVVMLICMLGIDGRTHAYRTGADLLEQGDQARVAWQSTPIEIVLNDGGGARATDAAERLLVDAIAAWNEAACAGSVLVYGGQTTEAALEADGVNTVQWVGEGWSDYGPEDAAGSTRVEYDAKDDATAIVEVDIYLNAESMTWLEIDGSSTGVSLRTVLRHEIGHAIGLAHPCEIDGEGGAPVCEESDAALSLMHPSYARSQLALSGALAADDIDGLCFLYPRGDSESTQTSPSAEDGGCDASSCSENDAVDGGLDDVDASVRDGGLGEIGDPCSSADDCGGAVCVAGYAASGGICSRRCGESAGMCPFDFHCDVLDERAVCLPNATAEESDAICSAAPHRRAALPTWLVLGTAVTCFRLIRRRRA